MGRTVGARVSGASTGARQRMWQAMRILRRITLPELIATAEAGQSNAERYLRALTAVEYLRLVAAKRNGYVGGFATWLLIRDTGPLAPRVTATGIWDPNRRRRGKRPIGDVLALSGELA